jgi:3-methyladenine DNA glycosylase AlkC
LSAAPEAQPALKEIFNRRRLRHIAEETRAVYPAFDAARFLAMVSDGLDNLSIMQRMRRVATSLHECLALQFESALVILRELAPRLNHPFAALALSEYVALYGTDHFQASMEALRFLTPFGSSEFAIRHFLERDLDRTLGVMLGWSLDENEHVRRLASEGSRPRLPWSFRLQPLIANPSRSFVILERLRADPSVTVRKSVANHLNDISKDHPDWLLDHIAGWSLEDGRTAWIVRHGMRTLIKKGHQGALAMIGAAKSANIRLRMFAVEPAAIRLGQRLTIMVELESIADSEQRLVVDYAVHYVKQRGPTTAKVFKLRTLTLCAREIITLSGQRLIGRFSTRVHYPGLHEVELLINGRSHGKRTFALRGVGATG